MRTTIPVLWLTGDGDPQDPPANLSRVASQQPDSLGVVMPAQEHVVGHLGRGSAVIGAFIEAGTTEGLDTACVTRGADPSPTFRSSKPRPSAVAQHDRLTGTARTGRLERPRRVL